MKSTILSAVSGLALVAALAGASPAQENDSSGGGGIDRDALTSEQVEMVREHCAALLAQDGAVAAESESSDITEDAEDVDSDLGDPAQPEPSAAADDLPNDPLTESELADRQGTSEDVDGEMGAEAGASTSTNADAAASTEGGETNAEGETSAEAVVTDNAAVPADQAGSAQASEFDLSAITAQDCIDAGIPG